MPNSMSTNEEILAQDGVALKSVAHPQDEKMIERLCRAVCKVYRIPADFNKLWEAQRDVVQAVLDELAVIDSEMQLNEASLETISIHRPHEAIEIEMLEGETLAQAAARLGL